MATSFSVEQVLAPRLEPGQVVILDNLAAHKVPGVRPLIENCGAQLLYLPPYSPDFNPIERATAQNARAFFSHCGYGIQEL
jgi:transposase